MNKEGDTDFDDRDLNIAERFVLSVSPKVAEFISSPDNFQLLGIAPERASKEATILFFDMSNSSLLAHFMSMPTVIDRINEYLEQFCDISLGNGAIVDKFIGDGAMLTFNVHRQVANHALSAANVALKMQEKFKEIKQGWLNFGFPVDSVYSRIGIESGSVYEAVMGHPQQEHITVMGETVNVAANMCKLADRTRDVIVIGENIYNRLSKKIIANKLRQEDLGKSRVSILEAYELVSIKGASP